MFFFYYISFSGKYIFLSGKYKSESDNKKKS